MPEPPDSFYPQDSGLMSQINFPNNLILKKLLPSQCSLICLLVYYPSLLPGDPFHQGATILISFTIAFQAFSRVLVTIRNK